MRPARGELLAALKPWTDDPKPWRAEDCRTAFDGEFWEHAFRTPFAPKLRSEFAHSAAR